MSDGTPGEAVTVGGEVAQRLLDAYADFTARQPALLQREFRSLSLATCQDIAQEAFLRVGDRATEGRLAPRTNVEAYLRRTARNLAVDVLRRRQRKSRRVILFGSGEALDSVPQQRGPGGEDQHVLRDLVIPAIERMPAGKRRQVVDLQSRGMSDADIERILGIPPNRLHNLRNKAVTQLRSSLAGHIRDGQHGKQWQGKQGTR
ncbi:RNA polymerase sigma factor [Streptomyces tanashiensis]|uniref:RNA polymerase sigma factor n=1 Tax=Streptomyces tanashiensis TaxID=67367 RepID=UPI0016764200|nr:sigma-70 family RNA polymerase sigma factor [Streptomyces tanashiensis]